MIRMVELASRKVLQARAEEQEKQLALLRQEVGRLQATQEPPLWGEEACSEQRRQCTESKKGFGPTHQADLR